MISTAVKSCCSELACSLSQAAYDVTYESKGSRTLNSYMSTYDRAMQQQCIYDTVLHIRVEQSSAKVVGSARRHRGGSSG